MELSTLLKQRLENGEISTLEDTTSADLKREKERQELMSMIQDREQRKTFADKIFTVTVIYIAVVLFILIACGFSRLQFSDTVLITLLSTTTANILSLLVIVFNHIFPKK